MLWHHKWLDEWHIFHIFSSEDIADVIPLFSPQNKDTFGDHFRLVFVATAAKLASSH